MKKSIYLPLAVLFLLAAGTCPGETPETILIRSSLGNDLSGHRRADADLVLSAYYEDFAAYQGNGNNDPRAWSVLHEDLDSFTQALNADLQAHRYETERTLPFIHVLAKKAMVTSLDSGKVVDRQSGAVQNVRIRRFWILRKVEDEWLITGLVEDIGDSLLAFPQTGAPSAEIVALLEREEEGWKEGNAGSIASIFDEEFIGYDGYDTNDPITWKIVFSDAEDLETWLDKRLQNTTYDLDRQVLYTTISPSNREALALSREKLSTQYENGDVTHSLDRYVLWTLSRQSGNWKITNVVYNIGLPD